MQVLVSEANCQKRINESIGKAKEIELVANATAFGINRIAEAMQRLGSFPRRRISRKNKAC